MTDIDVVSAPIQHIVVNIATGSAVVLQQTQKIIVNPGTTTVKIATVPLQHITVNTSDRTVVVKNIQQHITVSHATSSVSVINAGPIGPTGPPGPSEIDSILTDEGDLITQEGGVPVAISRAELANDPAFQLEIASFISAHVAEVDPHSQYLTAAEADALFLTEAEGSDLFSTPWVTGRNLFDNGLMRVAQRPVVSVTQTAMTDLWTADRWASRFQISGMGNITTSRSYVAAFPGTVSNNHIILQNGASFKASLAALDYFQIRQGIEGWRLQGLNWGTVNALPLTLSIAVNTSRYPVRIICELTSGSQFCSKPVDIIGNGVYTVTFPPQTTVIPSYNNTPQAYVSLWLAAGSTYNSGNLGDLSQVWHNVNGIGRASGCTNLFDRASQQFNMGAGQLEAGVEATPFEILVYGDELDRCRRYFRRPEPREWVGMTQTTTTGGLMARWEKEMRVTPVVTLNPAPYTSWVELPNSAFVTPSSWGSVSANPQTARAFWVAAAHAHPWWAMGSNFLAELSADI